MSRGLQTGLLLLIPFCLFANEPKDQAIALYEEGKHAEAYESLMPLAEQGDEDAQYLIGLMYAEGQGVTQDFYEAGKMYRRAAEQGHGGAQVNLGSLFENCYGNGPCNSEEAANWYRRAAKQGNPVAQYNLGIMYGLGEGVAEDEWTSKIMFRKAAEQGYTPAQFNLAVTYERGFGGPVDHVAAYAWYDQAARRGYKDALRARDAIASSMDAETLSKAKEFSKLINESYGNKENITF